MTPRSANLGARAASCAHALTSDSTLDSAGRPTAPQEELDLLRVPVKLWAVIKEQLSADSMVATLQTAAAPTASMRPSSGANVAGAGAAALLQDALGAEQLSPDIMQRCMPAGPWDGLPGQRKLPRSETVWQQHCSSLSSCVRHKPLRSSDPYGLQVHAAICTVKCRFVACRIAQKGLPHVR